MADEGVISSSSSFYKVLSTHPLVTYPSVLSLGNMATATNAGLSCPSLSANPFAIRMVTSTRSLADSTDGKESRPIVAPPTLKLGCSESKLTVASTTLKSGYSDFMNRTPIMSTYVHKFISRPSPLIQQETNKFTSETDQSSTSCSSSSMTKSILRPSTLAIQAEKLKNVYSVDKSSNDPVGDSTLCEPNAATHEDHQDRVHQSNENDSKLESNTENLTSFLDSSASMTETEATSNSQDYNCNKSTETMEEGSFIFGQNIQDRALNYDSGVSETSSKEINLTFQDAAFKNDQNEDINQIEQIDKQMSLTESAEEYVAKQVKRKFDEVAIVTGEEEESNVLQINCKLFSFDKEKMNWQEKSRGMLRLNDKENDGAMQSRLVMRTQGSLKVVLNTKIWPGMTIEHASQKTVRLTAVDSEGIKVYLVVTNPKDAEQLFSALDWRVTTLKSLDENSYRSCDAKELCTSESPSSGDNDICVNKTEEPPKKRLRVSVVDESGADSSSDADVLVKNREQLDSISDSSSIC